MEIGFLVAALVAGMLTVLAPCIVPVLPILLGGSAGKDSRKKALIITLSLVISIVFFTMLIRFSANSLGLSQTTLNQFAGSILIIFGIFTIFPEIWDMLSLKLGLSTKSNKLMGNFVQGESVTSNALLGATLGPVFTSCSPTYAAIVALVIQGDITYFTASIYTLVYAAGLAIMLLLIAAAGQKVIKKLGWATDPHGWFKRIVGVLFLLIGIAIITGFDKKIETQLLEWGIYEPLAEFEDSIRN